MFLQYCNISLMIWLNYLLIYQCILYYQIILTGTMDCFNCKRRKNKIALFWFDNQRKAHFDFGSLFFIHWKKFSKNCCRCNWSAWARKRNKKTRRRNSENQGCYNSRSIQYRITVSHLTCSNFSCMFLSPNIFFQS